MTGHPSPRRRLRFAIVLLGLALLLAFGLRFVLQPQHVAGLLLGRIGAATGLEIRASGAAEYHLRGTPSLVLRNVVAREPGASAALLRADRILLSLPWSTLRARGAALAATRLELDGVTLDLPALQHWLATRPPSAAKRLPTLTEGLRIRNGRIHDIDWDIDGIQVEVASFAPEAPLRARLRGRYRDPRLQVPVDLRVAIVRPAALLAATSTGFATTGRIVVQRGTEWQLPATITLSGPLSLGGDKLRLTPAKFGIAGAYASGDTRIPFASGIHGPLQFDQAVWLLAPARVLLHGRGQAGSDPVPTLAAIGNLALGRSLVLRLQGRIDQWPPAWPALPAPMSQSKAPLPFVLDYTGARDFTSVAALQLQQGAATLDARLRLRELQAWLASDPINPLPPLDATLHAPRLDIAGAQLQGVEITVNEPAIDAKP
ncbi:MAG: hypothetical protein ABIQ48_04435 [Luteimonas sp.]